MRRTTWCGVGAILVGLASGCSGEDTAPGSEVGQTKAGAGGSGGSAGSLALDLPGGKGGGGAGGMGGASAGAGTGGSSQGGTGTAGTASQAGSSSGGAKPAGMCKRVTGSDADCLDFYPAEPPDPARPQAYACDDTSAFVTLNGTKGGKCASVNFVTGSRYGACCPQ
jgi:hypothetical protein